MKRLSRATYLIIVLSAVLAAGSSADAQESTTNLADLLEQLTPEGWTIYDGVSRFTPDNLYEQINGKATFYLAYDVEAMTFAGFEDPADPGRFVDVSVFDMGTPTNAFGVFSTQRPPDAETVDFGRAACREAGHHYVWDGRYYVQIVVSAATEDLARIAETMAATLAQELPDSGEPVPGLQLLPEEYRIANSERYFKRAGMGLDFLNDTYMADYAYDEASITAFLATHTSDEAAVHTVEQFRSYASSYGDGFETMQEAGKELTIAAMGGQYDLFLADGPLVMGVYGAGSRETAVAAVLRFAGSLDIR